ncbi:hypothetical protein EJB05_08646, partial [Eragrostis curvula]
KDLRTTLQKHGACPSYFRGGIARLSSSLPASSIFGRFAGIQLTTDPGSHSKKARHPPPQSPPPAGCPHQPTTPPSGSRWAPSLPLQLRILSSHSRASTYTAPLAWRGVGICQSRLEEDSKYKFNSIMVLDALSSPHRRSQNTFFMPPSKKSQSSRDDLGSWSALIERHRFLLTTLVVLAFLCTIYLYFAVTLGAPDACSGLADTEREECLAKSVMQHGKLKFH